MTTLSGPNPSAPAIQARPNLPPPPVIIVSGGVMSPLEAGTAAVLGEPYSGVQTITVLKYNQLVLGWTTGFFRDGHGRTRVEWTLPTSSESSPITTSVTINDPVSGEEYTLEP